LSSAGHIQKTAVVLANARTHHPWRELSGQRERPLF